MHDDRIHLQIEASPWLTTEYVSQQTASHWLITEVDHIKRLAHG
jgi:hypothetical protein